MRSSQIFASILAYAAAVLGDAAPGPAAPTPLSAATPTASLNNPDPADLPALFTPPPGPIPQAAQLSGDVTIGITNELPGTPALTIVGASNAGVLPPRTPVSGQFSRTTSIVVPSGWAGAFTVDVASGGFNSQGSRIEGNWGVNDPMNQVYLDISYVTGYSVPIVCGCGTSPSATPVTGCNKNLFALGTCPSGQQQGPSNAAVCLNRSPTNGPPQSFFAPVSTHRNCSEKPAKFVDL